MKILTFLFIVAFSFHAIGQQANVYELADPTTMKSRIPLDLDSYFFHAGEQFYSIRPGFIYGLLNERHAFGITIPFVHNIFVNDYAGFENTTGLGDIQMRYTGVPYLNKNGLGLSKVTTYFEASAPTGESQLGRGAGTWLYKPGIVFSIKPAPEISLYPEVKFQFSSQSANSLGGGNGLPDPEDPDKDGTMQNLFLSLPAVIVMDTWDGWFSLNAQYIHSFSESTNFFFMGMDLGKMMGQRSSASLHVSKFISGQPRVNVIVQARLQFLLPE